MKKKKSKEFCIMPPSPLYETERRDGLVRHEVFFGHDNRQKSIDFGLVVFLTPEMHNIGNKCVHRNIEFDLQLKLIAERTALEYYGWTIEDFIKIFGRNYI